MKIFKNYWLCFCIPLLAIIVSFFVFSDFAFGVARQSTISMSIQSSLLSLSLTPTTDGVFGESGNASISLSTDNYTGYSLSLVSAEGTSLVNENGDEVRSLTAVTTRQSFLSDSIYNNQWGFKPSQYVTTSGGLDTVVENNDFLPVPTGDGLMIDKTSVANSSANTYSLSFGARVDTTISAGAYSGTYVLIAVANSVVFNVTYDDNTTDTVTSMPVPNPQTASIDGGTPVADSYITISDAIPVRNEKKFAGWCDVATTVDAQTGNDVCSGNLYQSEDNLPVDQTAGPNITLYAVWADTLFPIVWNQMGACEFHGSTNDNITGTECTDYHDVTFIDTGIALYNQENYLKDYEIHFTIDHYLPNEQANYYGNEDNGQQTFVNAKLGSTAGDKKAPGVNVRRQSDNMIQVSSKLGDTQESDEYRYNLVHDVSVFRLDNKIYYSYDNGPLILVQDITGFNQQFGLTTWFGAYPRDDCTGNDGPCTSAKRIPEATLSNMYIRLGEYSPDDVHEVTFNANGGTPSTTSYLVKDGNSLTTLPSATYDDHIFQGWFTETTGGSEITSSTVPVGTPTYYAQWLGTVVLASITNDQIALEPNETETVIITNSAELEPYTFSSGNTSVATVNLSTGEITAIAAGTTTITMTGTTSGETKTIVVTVSGQVYDVYFDSQGGSSVSPNPWTVGEGGTINPLPTSIKTNAELDGWYTSPNGAGTKLTTSTIFTSSTPTQYYAYWIEPSYVCKPATTLHTETCSRTDSSGCRASGYINGATITYGSLIQQGATTLSAGNAMTCDINADGLFDETDERFYYITTVGDNAALLYYKNINNNENEWDDALTLLPTSSTPGWINPYLVSFGTGDYNGKVTRYMSYDETRATCGNSTSTFGTNGKCLYILEQSNFANTNIRDGYWVGSTNKARVHTASRSLSTNSGKNGIRPMIEVPMDYVSLRMQQTFNITFDPHNETATTTVTVDEGQALSSKIPSNPTYANHLFQGWFTAETGGSQIDALTVPTGDTTYHAQWLKTVALAELARDTIAVEEAGTATIIVVNSNELESYTFSSNDTSIVAVDANTGVITGVAEGSTTITMTGTTSGVSRTINVNVTDLLPVTQAIIANNDLTVPVGGQITVIVSNAGELEYYTFSSADDSIATVNSVTGIITGVGEGTTNIIMTGDASGLTKTLEVDVTAAPATVYTVTFNPNGGSFISSDDASRQVEEDAVVGALPTPTRTNYRFFGWYSDDSTFYDEIYDDEVITADITFYARWIEDTTNFPIVFAEINECTFMRNAVMSGNHCTQDKTMQYVDTGVALFSTDNFQKDFEIGFTIVEYSTSPQPESQATLVNSKRENEATNYPGFVMRRSGNNFQLTGRFSNGNPTDFTPASASTKRMKIIREDGILKYSFNDGALVTWYDISNNTHRFDTNVWFGAAISSDDVGSQRQLNGKLTDMYIKLGVGTDYLINWDAGAGTTSESSRTIEINDPVGELPTVTPPSSSYTFVGWFDESVTPNIQITASTVPDGNKTYSAHYIYDSSDEPVVFNIANDALLGYQTTIADWVESPVNITTFNKVADPINNSTWGDTSELSERDYWLGLKANFETNLCSIPSYSDATKPITSPALPNWSYGSVDCSKPNVYDTLIGAPLNVYLYDTVNGTTVGTALTYTEATDGIIRNMIPGNTYKWEKDGDPTVYGYVTATSVKGRRFLVAGSMRNVRDLGGLPVDTDDNGTIDGTIEYGRLIRGERIWSNDESVLTNLGINKEYDVGNPSEYRGDTILDNYTNDEVIHYNFNYNSGDENNASSNYMRAWTAVTDIMTDITDSNSPKNIFFHCRVGADRTGTVAYLLEGLLGVPDEERYQEYSLTHLSGLYDRARYYKQKSSTNNEKFVFMMDYVRTKADILTWYMHNPNANISLIQAFRTAMISNTASSQQNSNQHNSINNSLNSSQSLSLNYLHDNSVTPDVADNDSVANTDGILYDAYTGYEAPLGVTTTYHGGKNNDEPEYSPAGLIALAVAAIASTGVTSYALAKEDEK